MTARKAATRKQVKGKAKGPSPEARPKRQKRPKPEVAPSHPDEADTEAADLATAITRGDADALGKLAELLNTPAPREAARPGGEPEKTPGERALGALLTMAAHDAAAKAKVKDLARLVTRVARGNEPHARDRRTLAELESWLEAFRRRKPKPKRKKGKRKEAEAADEPTVPPANFEDLRAEVEKGRADLAKYEGRPTPPPLNAEELDRLRWLHDAMRDARTRPDDSVPDGHRIPDEIALDVLDPLERALTSLADMPEAREALEYVSAAVHRLLGYSNLLGRDDLKELSTARPKAELALLYGSALMGLGVGKNAAARIIARDLGMHPRTADRALDD